MDSGPVARNGDAQGGAAPTLDARVGTRSGSFSGVNQYLILPAIDLTGDFTVMGWLKTTGSGRCAALARSDRKFILEINGDGSGTTRAGDLAWIVTNSGTRCVAAAGVSNINNGAWHHVAGVRRGQGIYLYLDGVRMASALLPSGFPSLGLGAIEAARNPENAGFLAGNLDELAVYSRALDDFEIMQRIAVGANNMSRQTYTSEPIDAGGPAIWESMNLSLTQPHAGPLLSSDTDLVGLWRLDDLTGGVVIDSSAGGRNGTLSGTYGATSGMFSNALSVTSGGFTVPHNAALEPANFSVEAWVRAGALDNRAIVEKRSGGSGYALYLNASGQPAFRCNGAQCASVAGFLSGRWNHIAGVRDGASLRLYVNGRVVATAPAGAPSPSTADLLVGFSANGLQDFVGSIDEVAIHSRALNAAEVADHARMGLARVRVQARAADSTNILAVTEFIGPDGTTNTYFSTPENNLLTCIPLGQYFQFRVYFDIEDGLLAPSFCGAMVKASRYPTDNPWVVPVSSNAPTFLGRLNGFSHVLATNADGNVQYQISGNGTNWYWWNNGAWETAAWGWGSANRASDVNDNIRSFYDQHYDKVGGKFFFKAFLHSSGNDQTALDTVNLTYGSGRITIVEPNGTETNQRSWLVDTAYTIRWNSAGKVSNSLKLEYSRDGGLNWTVIAGSVPNTSNYVGWVTPPAPSTQMLVRISDNNDNLVHDVSDSMFHLVDIFQVKAPNGGETWLLTGTNRIIWAAPGAYAARGNRVDIRYAADGQNFDFVVASGATNIQGSLTNSYAWYAAPGVYPAPLPSTKGRIRVHAYDNTNSVFNGQDDSDGTFALAGISVLNPGPGSYINNGSEIDLAWVSAGAGSAVAMDFSRDNGATWTNILASVPNADGTNHYLWTVSLSPADAARLRFRSLSSSNLYGISGAFQLADVKLIAPVASDMWELRQNKAIRWESGGAGNRVDLWYSVDGGGTWTLIESNVVNTSSNSYTWNVAPYPSGQARIRVVSQLDPVNLKATSPDFHIAGVRIAFPNGSQVWPMGGTDAIRWEYRDAGSEGAISVSQDGGTTWTLLGTRGLQNYSINWMPSYPSARALARIVAVSPPAWAVDMQDQSDAYFTVGGVLVTGPTNGQRVTVGTVGTVSWVSAGARDSGGDGYAYLYYTTTGGATSNLIAVVGNNEIYPGNNIYSWNTGDTVAPSLSAQIIVSSGPFRGISPVFVLRGMRLTAPAEGAVADLGRQTVVRWESAGMDPVAQGSLFLSSDGGATFDPVALNASPIPVSEGLYDWQVASNAMPSTNAVLKFRVTSSPTGEDINYEVRSRPFVMRGLKILAPATGSAWAHGSTNTIQIAAARAGNFATVYYSPDGVTYDEESGNEVALNVALTDGVNRVTWVVESARMPSPSARLKAVSAIATGISEPFSLRGVKVIRPFGTDIWAAGETNQIIWAGEGVAGSYDVFVESAEGGTIQVAAGLAATQTSWQVSVAAVSTGVVVRVRDAGGYQGVSAPFRIVAEPTIIVVRPQADELWRVTDTYPVTWSRGGQMSGNFRLAYSVSPFAQTNEIYSGAVPYNESNNTFTWSWTIPDNLGRAKVVIVNADNGNISDESDFFHIVGKFQVIYPNGGESGIYARKPETIRWYTWGNVQSVDLYYSLTPLHEPASWRLITNNVPVTGRGTEPSSYSWPVADPGGDISTARIRVEQSGRPGARDDSDTDFAIGYYEITWNMLDDATGLPLDRLSVTESSGVSQSGLQSPVVRRYPYGIFDSVWSREYFFDWVEFNWLTEPSRTITRRMKRADVEPGYSVMASFTYEGGPSDRLSILAWLERRGQVLTNASLCEVSVYDLAGALVTTRTMATPQQTGVFYSGWDNVTNTLQYGVTYYAKVGITYSGNKYESALTYVLRLSIDQQDRQTILNAIGDSQVSVSNILQGVATNVMGVGSNLMQLAALQSAFRSNAMDRLDTLTGGVAGIQIGITNLTGIVNAFSNEALRTLGEVATNVSIMMPLVTNIEQKLSGVESLVASTRARILTRPDSMVFGTTNTILYKSAPRFGSTVLITVSNSISGAPVAESGFMAEIVPGLYQRDLVANWGSNSYVITCSDPLTATSPGWDSIVVRVGASPLTGDVALDQLLGDVARIEQRITNVTQMLSGLTNTTEILGYLQNDLTNVLETVTNMARTVNTLTNLSEAAAVLTGIDWGAVSNVGGLAASLTNLQTVVTNMQASLNTVTNLSGAMAAITGIQGSVSNLQTSVGALTNLQNVVGVLTNVDWGAVSNVGGLSTSISNMQATLAGLQSSVGGVSNYVVLLTNLPALASNVTNIQGAVASLQSSVGGLTNLGSVVSVLTNYDWSAVSNLGSLASTLTDIQTSVTNMEVALGGLTNLGSVVASLTNVDWSAVSNVGGITIHLTNLQSAVSGLQTSVSTVSNYVVTLTNLPVVASNVTNVQGAIAGLQTSMNALTNLGSVVASLTNLDWSAVSNVGGMSVQLTNIESSVSALRTSVGTVSNYVVTLTNLPSLVSNVTNMQGAIANLQTSVSSLTNLSAVVSSLTNVDWSAVSNVGGMSVALTNIQSSLTNLPVVAGNVTNIQGQVQVIQSSMASLTNLGAAISVLTNLDWSAMSGVSSMAGAVSNIQSSVTNLGAIQASVSNLAAKVATVNWTELAGMPDALNQLAPALQGLGTTAGSDLTAILRGVQDLSRQAGQSGASLGDVQSGIRSVQQALETLTRLQERLGGGAGTQPSDSLFGRLGILADNVEKVAGDASDAAKKAQSARNEAANAASGIQALKDAMGRGDAAGLSAGLDKVRDQLASVRKAVEAISPAKETAALEETVKRMAAEVEAFTKSTGVKWLTEMKEPPKAGTGEVADAKKVDDLNAVLSELRGRLEFLQKMIQEMRDKPVVEESLIGG